jgi:hypothetical protein
VRRSATTFLGGATVVVVLALATACGGSGSKHAATTGADTTDASAQPEYTLVATKKCLDGAGLHAYRNNGNKVVNGSGGELRVDFGQGYQWVYVVFGKDPQEARAIRETAVEAAVSHNSGLARGEVIRGVRLKRNVFYYADGGPVSTVEGSRINDCLK